MRKDISAHDVSAPADCEEPTAAAALVILLREVHVQGWSAGGEDTDTAPAQSLLGLPRRGGQRRDSAWAAGAPGDVFLTALYLAAEQTRLHHEEPYDVDRGLRQFNAWLDGEAGPSPT